MLARMRKSMDDKDQGFTLIELLVVMIIIGILASIAIPVFLNQRKKAVDSGLKSDLKTAASFEETYFVDNNAYIATQAAFTAGTVKFSQGNVVSAGVTSTGYCLRASNTGGSGGASSYYWYDSTLGGLQTGTPTATAPTGGICATSGLTFTQVS